MSKDSVNPQTTKTLYKQRPTAASASAAANSGLQSLDSRLQRISDKLQTTPYILTVPSDLPYKLDKRLADEWRRGTPFDRDEEQLQYLSFLPDWDHGLITPVGAWDNERAGMDTLSQSGRSTAGTPNVNVKKVKMSLSDYKKKSTGQPVNLSTKKEGEDRKQANGASSSSQKASAATPTIQQGQKRPREDGAKPASSSSQLAKSVPPSKKPKPSPLPSPAINKSRERASSPLELPPPISPTLPPQILEELARRGYPITTNRVDDEKVKSRDPPESQSKSNAVGKERAIPGSKSNGLPKQQIRAPKAEKTLGPSPTTSSSKLTKPSDKLTVKKTPQTEHTRKLVVRLKIPKSIRSRYERLLRTPQPRQKGEASKALKPDSREAVSKSIEREPAKASKRPSNMHTGDKRPRNEDGAEGSAPPEKRARAPSNLDLPSKPSTPVPAAFKSPVASHHGSAHKPKSSTPNVSHLDEVSTPQASIRNETPSAPDSVDRTIRERSQLSMLSQDQNYPGQATVKFYHRTQVAHSDQGRKLKRNCDSELKAEGDPSQSHKRAIAIGIESIFCFMASYTIRDEMDRLMRPNKRDPTWSTLFPYLSRVKHLVKANSNLWGLCCQLEAVCHIAACNAEHEYGKSFPSQAASPDVLMSHLKASRDMFVEGATQLSVDDLQHSFPNSWRNKAKKPLAQPGVKFDMKTEGEFYLPITDITTVIEAVRAGKSILSEWCRMEGVQWEPSIGTKLPQRETAKAKGDPEGSKSRKEHD